MTSQRPLAVVTGASSGIGEAFAARLARDGYDLVVTARREDRLAALAARLRGEHGAGVRVVRADLADAGDLRALEAVVEASAPDLLVNNAGFSHERDFLDLEPDEIEGMLLVHTVALTRLARAALPGMVARGRGTVVNVASIAAFLERNAVGSVYIATKAYVLALSQALEVELRGTGVRVNALCPGWVRTEIAPGVLDRLSPEAVMDADSLVDAALAGLAAGEVVTLPSLDDASLLVQVSALKREVVGRTAATGRAAERYRR